MKPKSIVFLHGFLGRPNDWNPVLSEIQATELPIYKVDIFNDELLQPYQELSSWGTAFEKWLQQKNIELPCLLVGYSMGGRLALHALKTCPNHFTKLMLVSTNPGYKSNTDRQILNKRILDDQVWAEMFLNENWNVVLTKWNSQQIFSGGTQEPARYENEYNKKTLSQVLLMWSLAKQQDMRELIIREKNKIELIVGAEDSKYKNDALEIKEKAPDLNLEIVSGASHRVIFDQPKFIADKINLSLRL